MSDALNKTAGMIDRDTLADAIGVLKNGLTATKRVRGTGKIYEDVPDQGERRKSAEILLSFGIGRPSVIHNQLAVLMGDSSGEGKMSAGEVVSRLKSNTNLLKLVEAVQANLSAEAKEADTETIDI